MKETAPVLDSTEQIEPQVADDGQTTVLEALQASPLAPLLDLPLPQLPTLDGLPQLPGIDQLLAPINDLASSFGTGVLGAFDPTTLLQQSSGLIDAALEAGMGGLKVLDQIWQSDAATNAQTQGRSAQSSGDEVVARGNDISAVTQDAAGTVQRGNAKLLAVAESFLTSAIASAPLALTPPGQIALITSATEHLGQALEVVAETRAELTGQTTQMSTLSEAVPVPAGPSVGTETGLSPFAIASSVLENVGKPLISAVTDTVGSLVETGTHAATATETTSATETGTRPASTTTATPSTTTGPGFVPSSVVSSDVSSQRQNTQSVVSPGVQPTDQRNVVTSTQRPAATVAASVAAGTGMGMVPPMTAARAGETELERTTPSYLVTAVNRTDVIGDLGTVVAPVLGTSGDPRDPDHYA